MKFFNIAIHWTHKARFKKLYSQGFSIEEISIMYKVPPYVIQNVIRYVKKPERV